MNPKHDLKICLVPDLTKNLVMILLDLKILMEKFRSKSISQKRNSFLQEIVQKVRSNLLLINFVNNESRGGTQWQV